MSNYLNRSLTALRNILQLLNSYQITISSGQSSGRKGTSLTLQGKEIAQLLKSYIYLDLNNELLDLKEKWIPEDKSYITVFLKTNERELNGIYERDIAVREGADGAIILIKNKNNDWTFPDSHKIATGVNIINPQIQIYYNYVVLVFAQDMKICTTAAMAITNHFLEDIYEQIMRF